MEIMDMLECIAHRAELADVGFGGPLELCPNPVITPTAPKPTWVEVRTARKRKRLHMVGYLAHIGVSTKAILSMSDRDMERIVDAQIIRAMEAGMMVGAIVAIRSLAVARKQAHR